MILAIETSSARHSLCFARMDAPGNPLEHSTWDSGGRSGRLISEIARHERLLPAVRLIAVGIGPGGFSGIRAAIATAKGLHLVLQCPLIGVCSADAVAHALPHVSRLGVFADAKRAEYYLTTFACGRRIRGPATVPCDILGAELAKLTLAVSADPLPGIPERACPDAAHVADLARDAWRANPAPDADIEPIYLRGPIRESS